MPRGPRKRGNLLCAHPEAAAAKMARMRAMIAFHGLVLAFTLATCVDKSSCGPSGKCIGPTLPAENYCDRWDRASRGTCHASLEIRAGASRSPIRGLPTGSWILPPMPAETPAAEVYQATSAVI